MAILRDASDVEETIDLPQNEEESEEKKSSVNNMVHLNEGFSTIKDYIFVVGTPKYTFKTPFRIYLYPDRISFP